MVAQSNRYRIGSCHLDTVRLFAVTDFIPIRIVCRISFSGSSSLFLERHKQRDRCTLVGQDNRNCVTGYAAMIFVGESMNGVGPPLTAIMAFLPLFIAFAGVIIAFRWELVGGVLAAVGALAEQIVVFFVWHATLNPYIDIFFFVGLGLVYCWWRTRRLSS